MRCLVTGGCGFIGSNLVDLLLKENHDVVVLDNLSNRRMADLPSACKFIKGNVIHREDVDRAMNGCQVVFHLAASVGNARSIAKPIDDATINVLGTLNILEAAREFKVQRVVYSSSAGIFGEMKQLPVREDHPCEPDSPYGCTKLCAEKLCLAYTHVHELSAVCLRYFNVYGPRQRYDAYGNVIPIFAKMLLANTPLTVCGNGEQTRDFVNVKDVVQANFLAATVPNASGVYNIGSGVGTSVNRLIEIMGGNEVIYVKPRPGDVLHSAADIEKAKKELGYLPSVTLTEGIKEYLDWFKQDQATEALTML